MWDPLLVDVDQSTNTADHLLTVKLRQARSQGGEVHTLHVELRPEYPDLAVHPSVRLHTLEQLTEEEEYSLEKYVNKQ
jgi:hypothetical protein